ncbi:MAG TPA: dipicolinate synthase subunit B, partial [Symbiobacteriaceae bacterium]|nr:dipicolinate synthase subunit B [Symbiobacteriaceae bacterium]
CLTVMPCTGNTLAKLANAINDSPVCMAAKAQMRNHRPVVLAVTTNDGLGMNARNLGQLLATRNVYFVPFGQDKPHAKPTSIDADVENLLIPTVLAAMEGRQLQPLLLGPLSGE